MTVHVGVVGRNRVEHPPDDRNAVVSCDCEGGDRDRSDDDTAPGRGRAWSPLSSPALRRRHRLRQPSSVVRRGVATGGFATASPRWFDGSGGMMTLSCQLGERATGDRLEGLRARNYRKGQRVCESQ